MTSQSVSVRVDWKLSLLIYEDYEVSLPDDLPVCVSEGGLKVEPLVSMRIWGQPTWWPPSQCQWVWTESWASCFYEELPARCFSCWGPGPAYPGSPGIQLGLNQHNYSPSLPQRSYQEWVPVCNLSMFTIPLMTYQIADMKNCSIINQVPMQKEAYYLLKHSGNVPPLCHFIQINITVPLFDKQT